MCNSNPVDYNNKKNYHDKRNLENYIQMHYLESVKCTVCNSLRGLWQYFFLFILFQCDFTRLSSKN